jgi:hypothetical protein
MSIPQGPGAEAVQQLQPRGSQGCVRRFICCFGRGLGGGTEQSGEQLVETALASDAAVSLLWRPSALAGCDEARADEHNREAWPGACSEEALPVDVVAAALRVGFLRLQLIRLAEQGDGAGVAVQPGRAGRAGAGAGVGAAAAGADTGVCADVAGAAGGGVRAGGGAAGRAGDRALLAGRCVLAQPGGSLLMAGLCEA